MNTRGLIELVVLNIGLDVGVISQQVFTLMVPMALVTTLMDYSAFDFSMADAWRLDRRDCFSLLLPRDAELGGTVREAGVAG
jgi:Kef-type K+ transport system membrane component KefB